MTCYDSTIISDEECLTLYDSFQSKNPDFDYESYPAFDLAEMSMADCFEKQDIPREHYTSPRLLDLPHWSLCCIPVL